MSTEMLMKNRERFIKNVQTVDKVTVDSLFKI